MVDDVHLHGLLPEGKRGGDGIGQSLEREQVAPVCRLLCIEVDGEVVRVDAQAVSQEQRFEEGVVADGDVGRLRQSEVGRASLAHHCLEERGADACVHAAVLVVGRERDIGIHEEELPLDAVARVEAEPRALGPGEQLVRHPVVGRELSLLVVVPLAEVLPLAACPHLAPRLCALHEIDIGRGAYGRERQSRLVVDGKVVEADACHERVVTVGGYAGFGKEVEGGGYGDVVLEYDEGVEVAEQSAQRQHVSAGAEIVVVGDDTLLTVWPRIAVGEVFHGRRLALVDGDDERDGLGIDGALQRAQLPGQTVGAVVDHGYDGDAHSVGD